MNVLPRSEMVAIGLPDPLPTILIFTCAEYGQANVQLAASYELALAGVNVCIASFAPLEARVLRLQELVTRHAHSANKSVGSVYFHECNGIIPYWDALGNYGLDGAGLMHPPGVSGALKCYEWIFYAGLPWSAKEHLTAIQRLKKIVETMAPKMVVVDPLFLPAIDACKLAGQRFMVLTPTSIKDLVVKLQPHLEAYWKYPVLSSGFPFPLEWWQIPLNLYLYGRLVMKATSSTHLRRLLNMRRSLGITAGSGYEMYPGVTYVCPALPEIDWPLSVIPDNIVPCGPIVFPFEPLKESDPELKKWLDNGPTVLINLGSHVVPDEERARETARAFRILLDDLDSKGIGKMQILWKADVRGDIRKEVDNIIGKDVEGGRVKVVPWLEAEPVSILQHRNVVCTVHHGGANSFYEGVWSGTPQIVLPVWIDTYEYANRVEFLNVGLFANRSCAPAVGAEELGEALLKVTGDGEQACKFRTTARRLMEVCQVRGNGRELASAAIMTQLVSK